MTGATGFVGRALVRSLLSDGLPPDRLRCLVRDPERALAAGIPAVSLVGGSLEDAAVVGRAVRGVRLAFHVAAATRALSWRGFERTNVHGTATVVEALLAEAPDCRLVHVSSLAAVGPSVDGVGTDRPAAECAPRSDYGRSKLGGELAVAAAGARLDWVILRPPVVYGPGDAATELLIRQATAPLAPVPWRPRPLSVMQVDDVVRALCLAAAADVRGLYLPLDGPERSDTTGLMRVIAAAFGRRARLCPVPMPLVRGAAVVADACARLRRQAGFFSVDKVRDLSAVGWVADSGPAARWIGAEAVVGLADGWRRLATAVLGDRGP